MGQPEEVKIQFWKSIPSTVSELLVKYSNAFWAIFIDANARVGSVASKYIGSNFTESENRNGTLLRNCLHHLNSVLVARFFSWRGGHMAVHARN